MDILIEALAAFAGAFLGGGIAATVTRRTKLAIPMPLVPPTDHEHGWDFLRPDGWWCSACGAKRP